MESGSDFLSTIAKGPKETAQISYSSFASTISRNSRREDDEGDQPAFQRRLRVPAQASGNAWLPVSLTQVGYSKGIPEAQSGQASAFQSSHGR